MKRLVILSVTLAAIVFPGIARADDGSRDDGFVLRAGGPLTLHAGDAVTTAIVVDGDATIAGSVQRLYVIDGNAVVSGTVTESVVVVSGQLRVEPTGVVHNVRLVSSSLDQAPGAQITGNIDRTRRWAAWSAGALFFAGFVIWAGMTVVTLAAGLAFAAAGGAQLSKATRAMSDSAGQSILAGVIAAVVLPVTGFAALVTIVGIPLGLVILGFAIPILALLGYVTMGTWLGSLILSRRDATVVTHPYAETMLGIAILQFVLLVPGLAPVAFLASCTWGAGAIALVAWRGMRGSSRSSEAPGASALGPPGPQASTPN